MSSVNNLTFAWWNTSLAPSGTSRSTPDQRAIACRVIINLITEVGADFIALGEMSELDIEDISKICIEFNYAVESGITRAGRSQFDICYAYNKQKIAIINAKDILAEKGNSTLKIAKRLDIVTPADETVIHLFISHWPSRLYCSSDHPDRHTYGMRLRDSYQNIISEHGASSYVIMLGDYNDEPFDKSLCEQVMASRDVDLVRRKKHLLFNPFWQHLCKRSDRHHGSGSYYYKGGTVTKWHTFDQLMYSQAFLTSNKWMYSQNNDLVHEIPELVELVMNPKIIFDHLPVFGRVERANQNG